MTILLIIVFTIGYLAIILENQLRINKAAAALFTGVTCWIIYTLNTGDSKTVTEQLFGQLGEISAILFFLLGAMTIAELIDSHNGFALITQKIKTRSKLKLLWIITVLTFFLSATLNNLTTAVVMTSFTSKLIENKNDRRWFIAMIIIAANAGGAFSPIGDVTTTMLWIGGQITAKNIILPLILPSFTVCLVPLIIISAKFRNQTFVTENNPKVVTARTKGATIILVLGMVLLLSVPVFKSLTHLPPFMSVLLSLSVLWIIDSIIHFRQSYEEKEKFMVTDALKKIDISSILFFLGILLAISVFQSSGILKELSTFLNNTFGSTYLIGGTLGLISSVVSNVPLVAATQGMYSLATYPTDHYFWQLIALTTGTGGSIIIIGSAAGIAVMGIEKIEFMWYLKKISWIAIAGFLAGILVFIAEKFII